MLDGYRTAENIEVVGTGYFIPFSHSYQKMIGKSSLFEDDKFLRLSLVAIRKVFGRCSWDFVGK